MTAGSIGFTLTEQAVPAIFSLMASLGYTYWQDDDSWLGYLDAYPDYMTQGTCLEDLKEHLLDLFRDLSSGAIPCVRRHAELEVA